jgi:hypothetical protein
MTCRHHVYVDDGSRIPGPDSIFLVDDFICYGPALIETFMIVYVSPRIRHAVLLLFRMHCQVFLSSPPSIIPTDGIRAIVAPHPKYSAVSANVPSSLFCAIVLTWRLP